MRQFISRHDNYFIYLTVLLNSVMAIQFLWVWLCPQADQGDKIYTLSVLMAFEFVMVHSGIFMSVFPRKMTLYLFFPFYGLFAIVFAMAIEDWYLIAMIYLVAVFNRMRFAFDDVDDDIKTRNAFISFLAAVIFFGMVAVAAPANEYIPQFGLTSEFLQSINYLHDTGTSGLFIEKPHTAMFVGVGYYLLLAFTEYKLKDFKYSKHKQ